MVPLWLQNICVLNYTDGWLLVAQSRGISNLPSRCCSHSPVKVFEPKIEPQEEFVVSENNSSGGYFPLGWNHNGQRQVRPGCFRPPIPEATGSYGCSRIKLAAHETMPVVFGEQGAVQLPMVHKGYAQRSSYHASVGRPRFLTQGPALRQITIAKCLLWSPLLRTGGISWMVTRLGIYEKAFIFYGTWNAWRWGQCF